MYHEKRPADAGAPQERQSVGIVISYTAAGVAANLPNSFKSMYHMPFLSDAVGLDVGFVGGFSTILTWWNALIQPVIGPVIDRTSSRMGRYRPWILFASILYALLSAALFSIPPGLSKRSLSIYYIIALFIWFLGQSCFLLPWQAMNITLSSNEKQRNRLLTARQVAGSIASYSISMVVAKIITGFHSEAAGYQFLGYTVSVVSLLSGIQFFFFTRKYDPPVPKATPGKKRYKLGEQLKYAATSKALLINGLLVGINQLSGDITNGANMYFLRSVLGNIEVLAYTSAIGLVTAFATIPLMPKLMNKIGRLNTIRLGWTISCVSVLYQFIMRRTFLADGYCVNRGIIIGYLLQYTLTSIGTVICGPAIHGLSIDTTDYCEWESGHRDAAFVASILSLFRNALSAFSTMIIGFSLAATGYAGHVQLTSGIKSGILNIVTIPKLIAFFMVLFLLKSYPAQGSQQEKIRRELEENRRNSQKLS